VESASDSIAIEQNESAAEWGISVRLPLLAVHIALTVCSLVMLLFCLLSATPGAAQTGQPLLITGIVLLGPMLFPAAYWHQHKDADRRDAALMLPWAFIVGALIAQTALTASTYTYPLRDMLWRLQRVIRCWTTCWDTVTGWFIRSCSARFFYPRCWVSVSPRSAFS
jgi:hypothetical protein